MDDRWPVLATVERNAFDFASCPANTSHAIIPSLKVAQSRRHAVNIRGIRVIRGQDWPGSAARPRGCASPARRARGWRPATAAGSSSRGGPADGARARSPPRSRRGGSFELKTENVE